MSRVVAGLLLLALALRLAWPHADPPAGLSWSSGIYTDPAANTLPARFAVEKPAIVPPTGGAAVVYPLLNATAWAAYRTLGVHRWSEGVLAALLGVVSVGAMAAALRRGPGRTAMACALALGATSAFLVPYSRILMAELAAAPLLALACRLALGTGMWSLAGAGAVAAAAALLGKLNAVGFLPALLIYLWLRRGAAAGAGRAALGGAIAAVFWGLVVLLPHRAEWLAAMTGTSVAAAGLAPGSLGEALLRPFAAFRDGWMFHQIPVVGAVGGFFALWTLSGREVLRRRVDDGSALFAFWFLSMFAYHSVLGYVAPRYFVLVALPLTGCAACQIAEWWDGRGEWAAPRSRGEWIVLAVFAIFLGFGLANLVFHGELELRRFVGWEGAVLRGTLRGPSTLGALATVEGNLRWGLAAAALLLPALALAMRRGARESRRGRERARESLRRAAVWTLGVALALDLAQWGWWSVHRRSTIERTTEDVAALLGPHAVLLGGLAPLVTEGTPVVPVPVFGDARDAAARRDVTHVLLSGPAESDPAVLLPSLKGAFHPVQSWAVSLGRTRTLALYRLPDSALAGRYAPSDFELGVEAVRAGRFDEAMQRFAAHRRAGRPVTSDLLVFEATCLAARGDRPGAEAKLRDALQRGPDDVTALRMLGALRKDAGDREDALRLWWRALRLDPSDATLRDLILRARGESSEP